MHHGTCVTHVPWCIPGSVTRGAGITFPAFLAHAQPAILRIWYEAHCLVTTILHQAVDMFLCLSARIQYAINLVLGDSSCHHTVCSSHPRSFQSTCNTTSSHNKIFKLSNRFEIRQSQCAAETLVKFQRHSESTFRDIFNRVFEN